MRRRHAITELAMLARRRKEYRAVVNRDCPKPISRKRKPLDCGNARCGVCHSDKAVRRTPTRQERRATGE